MMMMFFERFLLRKISKFPSGTRTPNLLIAGETIIIKRQYLRPSQHTSNFNNNTDYKTFTLSTLALSNENVLHRNTTCVQPSESYQLNGQSVVKTIVLTFMCQADHVTVLQLLDTKRQRYYLCSAEIGVETNHLDIRYRDEWEDTSSTSGSITH